MPKSKKDISQSDTRKIMVITKLYGTPPSLSCKKNQYSERTNLTEENYSLTNCKEVAKELNNFFVNVVKNPNIPHYENCDSLYENRAIFCFYFCFWKRGSCRNKSAGCLKSHPENDIPVKIFKINDNFFAETICYYFNKSLENS